MEGLHFVLAWVLRIHSGIGSTLYGAGGLTRVSAFSLSSISPHSGTTCFAFGCVHSLPQVQAISGNPGVASVVQA